MLEDVFEQNRIPFTTQSARMAGLSLRSPASEEVRFYVPYGWYEQASELVKALFDTAVMEDFIPEDTDDVSEDW